MQTITVLTMVLMLVYQQPDTLKTARITGSRNAATSSSVPLQHAGAAEIRQIGATSLAEALGTFSGLNIKDYGGIGGLKTINIRGFSSQHTGICYDGAVISDTQSGQVDISRFNLDNIGNTTVEISGTDDIFRSARLAGKAGTVILESVRSALDSNATHVTARMRIASFGTYNPYLNIQQRIGNRWILSCHGDYIKSTGDYPFLLHNGSIVTRETRLNSDVSMLNSELNLYGHLQNNAALQIKTAFSTGERGLPGSVVLYTQDPTERLWDRIFRVNSIYSRDFTNMLKFKTVLSYSNTWNRYIDSGLFACDNLYTMHEASSSSVLLWHISKDLDLSIAEDLVLDYLDSNLPEFVYPMRLSSYTALSAKYTHNRFLVSATLLALSERENTRTGTPAPGHSRLSPSASVSYKLSEARDLRLRASFRESYRLPTFNDLYYAQVGNKALKPETAWQTNLGLTWYEQWGMHSLSLTADGYFNLIDNKIVAIPSMFIWSMRNVGKVQMFGTDISMTYKGQVLDWLKLRASCNYSFQHAVDITDPSAKNYRHQIPYTPRHTGNAVIAVQMPWFNMSYTIHAVGERYSLAQNLLAYRISPYADQSISVNRTFAVGHRCNLHLSAEALNLGNINYDVIQFYPMPGRNYRLTVKITY